MRLSIVCLSLLVATPTASATAPVDDAVAEESPEKRHHGQPLDWMTE